MSAVASPLVPPVELLLAAGQTAAPTLSTGFASAVAAAAFATSAVGSALAGVDLGFGLAHLVRTVTGPVGLAITFVYSFLIAFALPGASEVVLVLPDRLTFGPTWLMYAVVIFVSGVGKTAGSVFAFHLGRSATQSGPVMRRLERSRFDVVGWSEEAGVRVAREYGYVGLALALCVPGFPDTISIYAFSVLEEDYTRFALATFAGSVGRLLVVVALAAGVLAVV